MHIDFDLDEQVRAEIRRQQHIKDDKARHSKLMKPYRAQRKKKNKQRLKTIKRNRK